MEHRIWVKVPGLPHTDEAAADAILGALEGRHGELGPVLGWKGDTMTIVLATDVADFAAAATAGIEAVRDALREAGLEQRHTPTSVEIELVREAAASERQFEPV